VELCEKWNGSCLYCCNDKAVIRDLPMDADRSTFAPINEQDLKSYLQHAISLGKM